MIERDRLLKCAEAILPRTTRLDSQTTDRELCVALIEQLAPEILNERTPTGELGRERCDAYLLGAATTLGEAEMQRMDREARLYAEAEKEVATWLANGAQGNPFGQPTARQKYLDEQENVGRAPIESKEDGND